MERVLSPESRLQRVFAELLRSAEAGVFVSTDYMETIRDEHVPITKLLTYAVEQGFLLHGTTVSAPISTLLPSPGDDLHDQAKRTTGVYATDIAHIALFKATISSSELESQAASHTIGWYPVQYNGLDSNYQQFYATIPIDRARCNGFVYIMNKDNFQNLGNGEFVHEGPVQPILALPVEPNDFSGEFKVVDCVD